MKLYGEGGDPPASASLRYVRGEIGPDKYWRETIAGLRYFDSPDVTSADCAARLREALTWGFWSLHALDRNDPFWEHTNRLATLSKLGCFAKRLLDDGRHLVDVAWLWIAEALLYGNDYLNPSIWQILLDAGELNADWLVAIAADTDTMEGGEVTLQLGDLVRALPVQHLVIPRLEALAAGGGSHARWAASALEHIAGKG